MFILFVVCGTDTDVYITISTNVCINNEIRRENE